MIDDPRLPVRFWDRVVPEPNSGCWLWTGAIHNGYGRASFRNIDRSPHAHRLAYIALVGQIEQGLSIDHLCRVRCCVNPLHLEAVSNTENVLRGEGPTAINARKSACINGHAFTAINVKPKEHSRWRECRECRRLRNRSYKARRRLRDRRRQGQ